MTMYKHSCAVSQCQFAVKPFNLAYTYLEVLQGASCCQRWKEQKKR